MSQQRPRGARDQPDRDQDQVDQAGEYAGREIGRVHPAPVPIVEAAVLLGVAPNTLGDWARQFGFPTSPPSPGEQRLFDHAEVVALRHALEDCLSLPAAIDRARQVARASGRP